MTTLPKIHPTVTRPLLAAFVAAFAGITAAQSQIIFEDTFNSSGATVGNDAKDSFDIAWVRNSTSSTSYSVGTDTGALSGSGSLVFASTNTQRGIFANFTTVDLEVGETLTLSFKMRSATAVASLPSSNDQFRIGFINATSASSYITTGNGSGYAFEVATGSTTADLFQFKYRAASSALSGGTSTSQFTSAAAQARQRINDESAHTMTLSLTRTTSTSNTLSFSMDGNSSVSATTKAADLTSFNRIGFHNAAAASFRIDDVRLEVTAIPEPSSFAALAGLGALGLVASRRRRSVC